MKPSWIRYNVIFDDIFWKKCRATNPTTFSGPFSKYQMAQGKKTENCKHVQQVLNNGHVSTARAATGDQAAKQTGFVLKLFTRSKNKVSPRTQKTNQTHASRYLT